MDFEKINSCFSYNHSMFMAYTACFSIKAMIYPKHIISLYFTDPALQL